MRKRLGRALALLMSVAFLISLLFCLSGCGKEESSTDITEERAESDAAVLQSYLGSDTGYADVLASYETALAENYDVETMEKNNLCYLVTLNKENGVTPGYTYADVNQDSVEDLVLGANGAKEVYAIYINGNAVCMSTERDRYYIGSDGYVYREASSGATESSNAKYEVAEDGTLNKVEEYLYSEDANQENPTLKDGSPITESNYKEGVQAYRDTYQELDFTDFT